MLRSPRRDFTFSRRDVSLFDVSFVLVASVCFTSSRLYVLLVATLRFPRRDVSLFDVSLFLVAIVCFTSSRLYVLLVATSRFPRHDFTFSPSRLYFLLVATLRLPRRDVSSCDVSFLVRGDRLFSRVVRRDNRVLSGVYRNDCSLSLSRVYRRGLSLFTSTTPTHQN